MIDKIFYFIMVPMVYLAFAWCVVGIIMKLIAIQRAPKQPYTLKIFPDKEVPWPRLAAVMDAISMPTIRKHKPTLWFFLVVFHAGIVMLILGHLDLLPQVRITSANSPHMIGNGALGLVLTLAVVYFLFRRFRSPVREVSVPADYLLLFLIFCVFVTGDIISWGNSWSPDGFVISKQDFRQYLSSLLSFSFEDPRKMLPGSHYAVVVVHVLLANLFLMLLPFSKIVHGFFAIPMNALRRV